jgi:agmatine deiminase
MDAINSTKPRNEGDRMADSYVNFYIANGSVVVDPHDRAALETLQAFISEHKVLSLPARGILLGGGNTHCIAWQQPKE